MGTGIKLILSKEPKTAFTQTYQQFIVTFRRKPIITNLPRNYPETTQKILDAIKENPFITRTKLAEITGLTNDGVKYNLTKLKKNKTIKRIGSDKGGRWEIKQ